MGNEEVREPLVINELSEHMHVFISHFKDNQDYHIIEDTEDKVIFEFKSDEVGGELLYPFDEWIMFSIDQGDRIEIIRVDEEEQTWRRDSEYQHVFWPWRDKTKDHPEVGFDVTLTSDTEEQIDEMIETINQPDTKLEMKIEGDNSSKELFQMMTKNPKEIQDKKTDDAIFTSWQAEVNLDESPKIIPISDTTIKVHDAIDIEEGDEDDDEET